MYGNGFGILLDTVTGVSAKICCIDYDPMGGARYYGIGNEYMGVLLGPPSSIYHYLFAITDRTTSMLLTGIIFISVWQF